MHSSNSLGGSFSRFAIYQRGCRGRLDDRGVGGSFVANASTQLVSNPLEDGVIVELYG